MSNKVNENWELENPNFPIHDSKTPEGGDRENENEQDNNLIKHQSFQCEIMGRLFEEARKNGL